jgi:hypothetical protein
MVKSSMVLAGSNSVDSGRTGRHLGTNPEAIFSTFRFPAAWSRIPMHRIDRENGVSPRYS